jgi:hypothetical protein
VPAINGNSATPAVPGVEGQNSAGGDGVYGKGHRGVVGESTDFQGVFGRSTDNAGVVGESHHMHGVFGMCHNPHGAGVYGTNTEVGGFGVQGVNENGDGVIGTGRRGVVGQSDTFQGVFGWSRDNAGVVGESDRLHAVFGLCHNPNGGGVFGTNDNGGAGVIGVSAAAEGVHGETTAPGFVPGVIGLAANQNGVGPGVLGQSNGLGPGVFGKANSDAGVMGFHGDPQLQETTVANDGAKAGVFGASDVGSGVVGYSRNSAAPAIFAFGGLRAFASTNQFAGLFDGNVQVNGDIFLPGADCAEQFDVNDEEHIEPGDVLVIDQEGALRRSRQAYDKKVAGVVSGAGDYKPGIVLDKRNQSSRLPVALLGKVFCKVDAQYAPIEVGDLLTSSSTPGCAMKAGDPVRAFGAVIGKALRPLMAGQGLIPILIALQ